MTKDYYNILGVDKSATKEDIKKAYKRLAKRYHPDLNKEEGSADKFKEINEAAAVLGDDKKREQYDRFGTADFQGFQGGTEGFDFSDFNFGSSFDFGEIFDTFFGGRGGSGRRRRGPARGNDLGYEMEVTLEEAAFGVEKHILIPRFEKCPHFQGSGAESDSDIKTCDQCNGSGYVTRQTRTPFGMFQSTTTCRRCGGEGKVVKEACNSCDGTGLVKHNRKIKVDVPSGISDGSRLRIAGEGEGGERGGPPGDLYILIREKEHDIFEREEYDLHLDAQISFVQAAMGDEIEVPTLKGKARLKIPPGTQTGTVFRLRGEGVPHLRGSGRGDELVKVVVQVPKKLSPKQKQILKEFDKETAKAEKGIFGKIKEAFE